MKKLLFILPILLFSISSYAQEVHFSCNAISEDNDKGKECKTGNMEWAQRMLRVFPLSSDGYISHIYTIEASDTLNADRAMTVVHNWMKDLFKNPENSIKKIDNEKHTILAGASFGFLGQENGFTRISYISGIHEIKVAVYPNSIVIKVRLKHYQLTGFNAFKGGNADEVGVNSVYPVITKGDYKPAFAQAFINANAICISTSAGLLEWLNKHYSTVTEDETW